MDAFTAIYDISSLGIKIATLTLDSSTQSRCIEARAFSVMPSALFPALNNTYRSEFDPDFLPRRYLRHIRQSTVTEDIAVDYHHPNLYATAEKLVSGAITTYPIGAGTRDFFSLLALIASGTAQSGNYMLDGNGLIWTASLSQLGNEKIRTKLGKFVCRRYLVQFSTSKDKNMPYVDMVTHNLLKQGNKLTLWFSEDRIPLKAVVHKGAVSVTCEITGYREQ